MLFISFSHFSLFSTFQLKLFVRLQLFPKEFHCISNQQHKHDRPSALPRTTSSLSKELNCIFLVFSFCGSFVVCQTVCCCCWLFACHQRLGSSQLVYPFIHFFFIGVAPFSELNVFTFIFIPTPFLTINPPLSFTFLSFSLVFFTLRSQCLHLLVSFIAHLLQRHGISTWVLFLFFSFFLSFPYALRFVVFCYYHHPSWIIGLEYALVGGRLSSVVKWYNNDWQERGRIKLETHEKAMVVALIQPKKPCTTGFNGIVNKYEIQESYERK